MTEAHMTFDWAALWRELAEKTRRPDAEAEAGGRDPRAAREDRERAERFDAATKRKSRERPDTLLDFMLQKLRRGQTVLDIGAGTGHFAIAFAKIVDTVVAVEPSPSMRDRLQSNAISLGQTNIRLLPARWEDAEVEPCDVAFCSHAMYSSADLVGFVRKMQEKTRETCVMVMRVPSHDGVLRELSTRIHGQPYDSPNFWVGYNVLYEMGIYASVVMEPFMRYWTDLSLEDALPRARRHLGLGDSTAYDEVIRETLERRLRFADGQYIWPDGMRSALMWWSTPAS